ATGETPRPEAAAVARRAWALTEEGLKQHVEPPSHQEMLLAGALPPLKAADAATPADLSRLLSALATGVPGGRFVRCLWAQPGAPRTVPAEEGEEALLPGLRAAVPGKPHLLNRDELRISEQLDGNRYVGTGIQISLSKDKQLTQIILAFPSAPARRAGA